MTGASSPLLWLDRLFREEQPRLRAGLQRWLGRRDLAEDALQDTFTRLAAAGGPPMAGDLSSYIARSARNAAIDRLRSPGSRSLGDAPPSPDLPSHQPDPEDVAAQRQRARRFAAALAELPAPQRAMVLAARVHGHSHAAIAARHGTSPAAVEKTIARALRRLAAIADGAAP